MNMRPSTVITVGLFALFSHAETHVIHVDQSGTDDNDGSIAAPVATISRALSVASSFEPTEDMPVLIQCGQGSFAAPDADWTLNARHVYFRGNGAENSRLAASTITLGQDSITGFKDISIDAALDIGGLYVPVEGVKVLSLDAASGRLVGTYYDAAGRLHTSSDTVSNPVPLDTNRYERGGDQILVAPDQDASNTFVLKAGDTMTGPLTLPAAPSQSAHAATKGYVDALSNAAAALYLRKTGDTMSGPLDMAGNAISNVGAITFNTVSLPCQTGIVLWLDASSLSGLSDGDPVQTWDDRSTQNNDATCSGTPATYRAGVLNGQPVIRFTGTNSYYSFAAINDIRGVFWVMMEDADAANNFHPVLGHSTTYQFHRGYNKEIYGDAWAPAAIKNGQTRINGQLVNGTATVVPTTFSLISLITAGNVSANQFGEDRSLGRYWDGDVAEIIIYNVALTDAQREATEEYLSRKYALGAYSNSPPLEPLTIDGTGIHNAPAPQSGGDAATKAYVDMMSTGTVADARYVRKDGDTMLGVLSMSSNRITGLGQPTAMRDATTKEYVDQGMDLLTSGLAVTGTASAASAGDDWGSVAECLVQDGNYVETQVTVADPTSSWLYVTGWNVSVPERAVIKGISLRVLFSGYAFNPTNYCSAVLNARILTNLYYPCIVGGASGCPVFGPGQDETLGGTGGEPWLWDMSLTPAMITDPGFGFALRLTDSSLPNDPGNGMFLELDYVEMIVHYIKDNITVERVTITGVPSSSNSAITLGYATDHLVRRDGSTPMTGDMNMGGRRATNLADPMSAQDAANREYVDSLSNANAQTYLARAGSIYPLPEGTSLGLGNYSLGLRLGSFYIDWASFPLIEMSYSGAVSYGPLCMQGNRIRDVADPLEPNDVASRSYVDGIITNIVADERYVAKFGDTMTGPLHVPEITLTGTNDWRIGDTDTRTDIVMMHPDAQIRAAGGELSLSAGSHAIAMKSFVNFSPEQFGTAAIPAGTNCVRVPGVHVALDSVVLVTPCGVCPGPPYGIIDPVDTSLWLRTATCVASTSKVNFVILNR